MDEKLQDLEYQLDWFERELVDGMSMDTVHQDLVKVFRAFIEVVKEIKE